MNTTQRFNPPTSLVVIASIASAIVMTACGPENGAPAVAPQAVAPVVAAAPAPAPVQAPRARPAAERERSPVARNVGEVSSIEPILSEPKATGAGAVIGGVAGGLLGNQIGDGNGRKAATVVGALGGAYAGNRVEKSRSEKIVGYRVSVRMDAGGSRTVRLASRDGLEVGERVRVDGDNLHRV